MQRLVKGTANVVFVRQVVRASFVASGFKKHRNLLYAVASGTGLGAGYAIWRSRPTVLPDLSDLTFAQSLLKRDLSTYAHHVDNSLDPSSSPDSTLGRLTLYQFYSCPFCCKVRAYLDYFGINYDIVEVNSVSKSQLKWSDYKKVPILVLEDNLTQVNDSNVIISALEARRRNKKVSISDILPLYGPSVKEDNRKVVFTYNDVYKIPGSVENSEEIRMREWVDKHLIPVAGLSIYDTLPEAIRSFKWFSEAGKWQESFGVLSNTLTIYSGAAVMYVVSKLRKRRAEQPNLNEVIAELSKELSAKSNLHFLGGSVPNIADICAYGALSALRGCDKFEVITADQVVSQWWNRMSEHVQNHKGAELQKGFDECSTWSNIQSSILPVLCIFLAAKLVGVQLIYDHVV